MDLRALWYTLRGWIPHRDRKWAERYSRGKVVVHFLTYDRIFTVAEARWLAAELLLAARDADKEGAA